MGGRNARFAAYMRTDISRVESSFSIFLRLPKNKPYRLFSVNSAVNAVEIFVILTTRPGYICKAYFVDNVAWIALSSVHMLKLTHIIAPTTKSFHKN